jgi:RimJ/RimL family protein N-acetyltransferase
MYGPVLKGKLVTLRPPRLEEAPVMASWLADLEITHTVLRRFPPSVDEEKDFINSAAKAPNDVFWALEMEGKLVGVTGIHAIDWINRRGQTGIIVGEKAVWGKGVATEAMRLRTEYAFRELNLHKLTSAFLEGNLASWKAMQKAGYREVGRRREQQWRDGRWVDEILTEVLRADWEKLT